MKIYFTLTCAKDNLFLSVVKLLTVLPLLLCVCSEFVYRHSGYAWTQCYLLLLCVELKALSEGAGLRLMMLFPVQIHALSIGDVLLLGVSKQTAGNIKHSQGRDVSA